MSLAEKLQLSVFQNLDRICNPGALEMLTRSHAADDEPPQCDHDGAPWSGPDKRPWERCPQCGAQKPVSTSEIDLHRKCQRKWAFRFASRIPKPPQDESRKLGLQLHALIERYGTTGELPQPHEPAAELMLAGREFLPRIGSGAIEQRFQVTLDGVLFVVIPDWTGCVSELPAVRLPVDPNWPAIFDAKTSSNPKRYGIWSDADRLDDSQHLLYDEWALVRTGADAVFNRWLYYPTKTRGKVVPSDGVLTRREVRGGFERIVLPIASRILELRSTEPDPNSLEANAAHCNACNRLCEYAAHCTVSTADHVKAQIRGLAGITPQMEEIGMSGGNLFASLPGVNGAPAQAQPAPAAAPAFNFGGMPAQGQAPQTTAQQPAQPPAQPQSGFPFSFAPAGAPAQAAQPAVASAPAVTPAQAPAQAPSIDLRAALRILGAALRAAADVLAQA